MKTFHWLGNIVRNHSIILHVWNLSPKLLQALLLGGANYCQASQSPLVTIISQTPFFLQVRVYTPKRLFHQLEAAKEEFIRATVGIWKEQKILLPKLVEAYAKDVKLSSQGLVDMVQRYLPESLRMAMQKCQQSRSSKIIEWVPHNLNFRYLLSRDLAFPHLNWLILLLSAQIGCEMSWSICIVSYRFRRKDCVGLMCE